MPDPSTTLYWGIPGYGLLWLLTLVSFGLFGHRVMRYIRKLKQARGENRLDNPVARLRQFAAQVLGQRRLFDEPAIGAAHFLIFWSFVLYASSFFWNLVRGLLPFLPVPYADEVGWVAAALAVFGVLGLAALVVAAIRRYAFTPQGLERSRDATLILILIAVVLVSSLAGAWQRERAPGVALGLWWLHMATVLGFLAYLPYSKHLHLVASPFGVLFGALSRGGIPPPSEGAARAEEFTWRQLFSGLACAECGRCERACPAVGSGAPLSPKELMHNVKELVRSNGAHAGGRALLGDRVSKGAVWACATCYACMERCPVFNEHIPVIVEMRRRLVFSGDVDTKLQAVLTGYSRYGNSFGASPRSRAKWTQQLGFKVKDARKEAVEYLWFVGDYASFDPRVIPVTCAAARVFQQAGLDFGILYEAENNSGNDVRRVGEEGLFEALMEKNLKAFSTGHFEHIVTTDPHSLHALKNEYRNGNGIHRIVHYTQLLDELVSQGKLPIRNRLNVTATYHDPCYLGRYNRVFRPPRRVLEALGVRIIEMPRNCANSYCCGAGGGLIWMEDAPGIKERPAESRVREAAGLPGVDTLVVSCPKDLVMFVDATKTAGLDQKLAVRDVIQLVEQGLGGG